MDKPKREPRYAHPKNVYRSPWGTWYVQVQHEGERLGLGSFVTMEEAVEVRDAFRAAVRKRAAYSASSPEPASSQAPLEPAPSSPPESPLP